MKGNSHFPFEEEIKQWVRKNPNKVIGIISGFFIAVIILLFGWGSIVIVIAILLGYLLGKSRDEGKNIVDVIMDFVDKITNKIKIQKEIKDKDKDKNSPSD
jgi:uncharacterized membrane protein